MNNSTSHICANKYFSKLKLESKRTPNGVSTVFLGGKTIKEYHETIIS